MKTLIVTALIVLSALPATAADWRQVVADPDTGGTVNVDVDSIRKINGGYEYSVSVIEPSDNKYFLVRRQMLCYRRQMRNIRISQFSESGDLLGDKKYPKAQFKRILVSSEAAAEWEFICQ